jgi:hypothetical protein
MKKHSVKLRYNTECTDNHLFWRVLIDGREHLASHVHFNIPVTTTQDFLSDKQVTKHHISCESDSLIWEGDVLTVG